MTHARFDCLSMLLRKNLWKKFYNLFAETFQTELQQKN